MLIFFSKFVPLQTFQPVYPFLSGFVGQGIIIHTLYSRGNGLVGKSLLAKFHSHQPTAAWAKSTSVFHPRTSKLIIVGKPSFSQPFERLLDHCLRDFMLAEVLPNLG